MNLVSPTHGYCRLWLGTAVIAALGIQLSALGSDQDFDRKRAQLRANFEKMRSEHRAHMSPQARQFLDKMDADSRNRQFQQKQQRQAQIIAAARVPVSPSQCALSFNAALPNAKRFSDIQSYFSQHYLSVYLTRKTPAQMNDELSALQRAYIYDCKVRGSDKIESNGECKVWLEGFNADHSKGTWVKLRMIPEGNYWRIDGYDSTTGLNVIRIPKVPRPGP